LYKVGKPAWGSIAIGGNHLNITKQLARRLMILNDHVLGKRIRNLRKNMSLTQIDLANRLEISQADISNIERGKKKVVKIHEFTEILRCSPKFFMTGR
jgi:DNA-binding XRE family transcriptional regulator